MKIAFRRDSIVVWQSEKGRGIKLKKNGLTQRAKKILRWLFTSEKGLYLVFGGLTTAVSIIAYWISNALIGGVFGFDLPTLIKHATAIVFAYFTNRKYVFKSENNTRSAKAAEAFLFAVSRLATLFLDIWLLALLVEKVGIDSNIGTVITSVPVIILNYIAGKLYIFKRKE